LSLPFGDTICFPKLIDVAAFLLAFIQDLASEFDFNFDCDCDIVIAISHIAQ